MGEEREAGGCEGDTARGRPRSSEGPLPVLRPRTEAKKKIIIMKRRTTEEAGWRSECKSSL